MLVFADEPAPLGADWTRWARDHPRRPVWLAQVELADSPRFVGCYVTPARDVLGLRPWDDADDGAQPMPWALFDVEKLVRMALHQSGLAFEALTSPASQGDFPARQLADATVTADILQYYQDLTTGRDAFEPWRWRTLLTGALLARDGVVSHSLDVLTAALGAPPSHEAAEATRLREMLQDSSLPERPSDYDFANELVVNLRFGA